MRPINLATQPSRNERLPATLFALAAAALAAVTIWHALSIRKLLPARTSALHREVAALEAEEVKLRDEASSLRTETPPTATLAQWNLVKDLVDGRAFSWTGLFGRLEELIPDGVRLTAISPSVRKGEVMLDLTASVRSPGAGWEFVRVLEESDFDDVYPMSEAKDEFSYTMRYEPRPRPIGAAPAEKEAPPERAEEPAS